MTEARELAPRKVRPTTEAEALFDKNFLLSIFIDYLEPAIAVRFAE
jgi:hypothetical protein